MTEEQMWSEYTKLKPNAVKYGAWAFGGNTPDMPNILAQLVLNGKKTATASAFPCYLAEEARLPQTG